MTTCWRHPEPPIFPIERMIFTGGGDGKLLFDVSLDSQRPPADRWELRHVRPRLVGVSA
jgi:hypothetical protein